MKTPAVVGLLAGALLLAVAAPRGSTQIPPNWNHQISGITIEDNTSFTNPDTFGFATGADITFLTGPVLDTFSLVSVRGFALLYDPSNDVVGYETLQTDPIGSAAFGAQYAWKPLEVEGKLTGWEDSFVAQGSQKPGNIGPNEDTGLVFGLSRPLEDLEITNVFGFDLAVLVGDGQEDPFGNGILPGSISTGFVYLVRTDIPGHPDVPEPGILASLGAAGIAGGFWLRRRRSTR